MKYTSHFVHITAVDVRLETKPLKSTVKLWVILPWIPHKLHSSLLYFKISAESIEYGAFQNEEVQKIRAVTES